MARANNELYYYDTLRRIATGYQTVEHMRRYAEREYGLDPTEALEMAYENIIQDAKNALLGKRRPQPAAKGR